MRYRFKPGGRIRGVRASVIGPALEKLRQEMHGRLRPEDVLAAAKPARSPLHRCFEWDDTAAAEAYRLVQAGHLIRCVEVVFEEAPEVEPTRAFVHVVQDEDDEPTYTHVAHAMRYKNLREQVLAQALSEAKRWAARYKQLKELAEVRRTIMAAARKYRGDAA